MQAFWLEGWGLNGHSFPFRLGPPRLAWTASSDRPSRSIRSTMLRRSLTSTILENDRTSSCPSLVPSSSRNVFAAPLSSPACHPPGARRRWLNLRPGAKVSRLTFFLFAAQTHRVSAILSTDRTRCVRRLLSAIRPRASTTPADTSLAENRQDRAIATAIMRVAAEFKRWWRGFRTKQRS
jgi:hypothetical protein